MLGNRFFIVVTFLSLIENVAALAAQGETLKGAIEAEDCPKITDRLTSQSELSSDELIDLGESIERGICAPSDPSRALALYQQAHRRGANIIAFRIGDMYLTGRGTKRDTGQARRWFRLGALSEGFDFQFNELATWARVITERKVLPGILTEELKRIDAERTGPPERQFKNYQELIAAPRNPNIIARAVRGWLQISANNDYPPAMFDLAHRYRLGEGIEKDFLLFREFMWRAARSGYADAQIELGRRFLFGDGVPTRARYAYIWLRRAELNGRAVRDLLRKAARKLSPVQLRVAERDTLDPEFSPPP